VIDGHDELMPFLDQEMSHALADAVSIVLSFFLVRVIAVWGVSPRLACLKIKRLRLDGGLFMVEEVVRKEGQPAWLLCQSQTTLLDFSNCPTGRNPMSTPIRACLRQIYVRGTNVL
jgi:hypothetical protein